MSTLEILRRDEFNRIVADVKADRRATLQRVVADELDAHGVDVEAELSRARLREALTGIFALICIAVAIAVGAALGGLP